MRFSRLVLIDVGTVASKQRQRSRSLCVLGLVALSALVSGCAPETPTSPTAGAKMRVAGANNAAVGAQTVPPADTSALAPGVTASNLPLSARLSRFALEGTCEVRPKAMVPIKSQASGEVTAVRVEVGDTVTKGQVLIEISPRALNEQLQRNQLARERMGKRMALLQLQITTQKREAAVLEPLYSEAGNTKTMLAIRERETELESAKLELQELELNQRSLERELRYTQIQSPRNGVIVKRTVEPGQVVNAAGSSFGGGDGLLELADKSELELDCAVHAEDADLIAQRVPLVVVLSSNTGATVPVVVARVAPMVESKSQVPQLRFTAKFAGAIPAEVMLGARYALKQRQTKTP